MYDNCDAVRFVSMSKHRFIKGSKSMARAVKEEMEWVGSRQ